nr:MAG TPA: hypothetical protein [Caudoviricetes sp.]
MEKYPTNKVGKKNLLVQRKSNQSNFTVYG